MQKMYSMAKGQCTNALHAKLESQDEFEVVSQTSNAIGLLCMIRDISFNFQSQKYDVLVLMEAEKCFLDTDKASLLLCPTIWRNSPPAGM
jgi:hypothetical protein